MGRTVRPHTELDIDRSVCILGGGGGGGGKLGRLEGVVHNYAFPQADTQYACLHVTLKDSMGAFRQSFKLVSRLLRWSGHNFQATCEPMGCHIIIITVIIYNIINYKYYHNIQTSFGLGIKSWPQRHLQE